MSQGKNLRLAVRRETWVDRLVHLLQESILSGKLRPKTKLSESQAAEEFDVTGHQLAMLSSASTR
jgi:DNA-binding GntR family transcriptional regulator